MYVKGMFSNQNPPELNAFFIMSTKNLASEVENWPELGKK